MKDLLSDTTLAGMAKAVEASVENSPSLNLVRDAWREVLDLADDLQILSTDDFMDIGGHSLKLAQLTGFITKEVPDIDINVKDLLSDTTLAGMAKAVELHSTRKLRSLSIDRMELIDLPAEASLDASIYPAASRRGGMSRYRMAMSRFSPRRLLLTGGTGYLGAFILHNLCIVQNKPTYALVRAADVDAGRARLVATLRKYGLLGKDHRQDEEDDDLEMFLSFVVPVCGDLQKPLLGMEKDVFRGIAGSVDAVIHCAADVNLFKPYHDLKKTNVLGTQETLRLTVENGLMGDLGASFAHTKAFVHISSNGVFPSTYQGERGENSDLGGSEIWSSYHDGYGQSKWVAEKMVSEAGDRGVPMMILRPGNMGAASSSGVWNNDDFYSLFLRCVIELGVCPDVGEMDALGWELDLTPVDWAANMIVKLACEKMHDGLGSAVHIQNPSTPIRMSEAMALLKEIGFDIDVDRRPTISEWVELLEKNAVESEVCAKSSLAMDSFARYFATGAKGSGAFSTTRLEALLPGNTQESARPNINAEYLKKALAYLGVVAPAN